MTRGSATAKIAFASILLLGLLLALVPSAGQWFAARAQSAHVTTFTSDTAARDAEAVAAALDDAEAHNRSLTRGVTTDPFADTAAGGVPASDEAAVEYSTLLSPTPGGAIATVSLPASDVTVPVFHGSADATLEKGAGHIYGSSLPVGGADTHAVIIGHSGTGAQRTFNALHDTTPGDLIAVDVPGRQLTYRVTGTEVVAPTDVSSLAISPGRDLLTLVTCTPTGVNSHRLLVHAERIPDTTAETAAVAPFPRWALAAGLLLAAWTAHTAIVWRGHNGAHDPA